MTNSTVPANLTSNMQTTATPNVEIIEEVLRSTFDESEIKSPKIRATIIDVKKEQNDYINFEVDFKRLQEQLTIFKINTGK